MISVVTKAMILAAGKGERMRPLTDNCPKPLLKVKGKALIEYAIENVQKAHITHLVINVSYLGEMVEHFLGNGSQYGVTIEYSREEQPLETGGGIAKAMLLLCSENNNPFLLVNSDVWCDIDLAPLKNVLTAGKLAHLVLVNNPEHNSKGDFSLKSNRVTLMSAGSSGFTYSGIAVIDPQLFKLYQPTRENFPLRDLLVQAIQHEQVTGQLYEGLWVDVGTPERLLSID